VEDCAFLADVGEREPEHRSAVSSTTRSSRAYSAASRNVASKSRTTSCQGRGLRSGLAELDAAAQRPVEDLAGGGVVPAEDQQIVPARHQGEGEDPDPAPPAGRGAHAATRYALPLLFGGPVAGSTWPSSRMGSTLAGAIPRNGHERARRVATVRPCAEHALSAR
jgi:hypothetical protein